MTNERFEKLFGAPAGPDQLLTSFHMDIAASIQAVLDEAVLRLTRSLADRSGARNLCLAGGVALNCVTNGKLLRDGKFENIWIQPAAGDAGGAAGAGARPSPVRRAAAQRRHRRRHGWCVLRPEFPQAEIERRFSAAGAHFSVLSEAEMIAQTAKALSDQLAVGWFQGRMEFGPRSLGARSILGDPRSPAMQKNLNLKVKYRESLAVCAGRAARGRRRMVRT